MTQTASFTEMTTAKFIRIRQNPKRKQFENTTYISCLIKNLKGYSLTP